MEIFRANDVDQLRDYLSGLGKDMLFRGQTRHYAVDGMPSATTSFDRHGCIPNEMLRWSRYADEALSPFTGRGSSLVLNQAILQHYGFRSFYLDCSASAAVSAWFAGHRYSEDIGIELSEDCDEAPVFLRKRAARYDPAEGTGHLYVLDRAACERAGLTDLTVLSGSGARTRPGTQSAFLLGPLQNAPLPFGCFLAHVEADCALFRQLANDGGFTSTRDLFPPSTQDPILDALLSLPWNVLGNMPHSEGEIRFFRRAIELPEYDDSFVKIASSSVAFYAGNVVTDVLDSFDGFRGGPVIIVPEAVLFGFPDIDLECTFPEVHTLVEEHQSVLFETPALLRLPKLGDSSVYQKGLALELVEPGLVHLGALMVRHPGQRIDSAGVVRGRFYRVGDSGHWQLESREGECPCGNDSIHKRDLRALHVAEHFLKGPHGAAEA